MSEQKSRLRKHVENIPDHERNLHGALTKISIKVGKALRKSDLTKEELEKKIDRHNEDHPGEYINRMFAGGIDLSLRTIYKLEEALDVNLIEVPKPETESSRPRRSAD